MKTAIYDKNGQKIAGDKTLPEKLEQRIVSAQLPLVEDGCLFSRESDGSISLINAEKGFWGLYEDKGENKRITKAEFIKRLLLGNYGSDIKDLCHKHSFLFDEPRRIFVAELSDDISEYISVMEEVLADNDVTVLGLDKRTMAVVCAEDDNDVEQTSKAISATFTELGIDHNIGISCIAENVSEMANAFEQAVMAIRAGKMLSYSGGIWQYSFVLPELIISMLSEDKLSQIKEKAKKITAGLDDETIELAQEFFKHNLNISETARYCYLHRNTLIYRLDRIWKETGFNLRNFDEAVAFRLYVAANKILK